MDCSKQVLHAHHAVSDGALQGYQVDVAHESSMLRLGHTAYGGRAYFATTSLPSGTLILAEHPTVACTLDDFKREVCLSCFAYHHGATLPVQVGTSSRACSPACVPSPVSGHDAVQWKWDIVQKRRSKLGDTYLDLLRFCIAALPLFTDPARKGDLAAWMTLQDDFSASNETERESATGVATALHQLFSDKGVDYREIVQAVAGRSKCNAFGIWQQDNGTSFAESEMLGFAIYTKASFFNHACVPNVEKRRVGRQMQFYTTRNIQADEELVISYLGDREYSTVQDRREALRGWGFDCVCTLCIAEISGDMVQRA